MSCLKRCPVQKVLTLKALRKVQTLRTSGRLVSVVSPFISDQCRRDESLSCLGGRQYLMLYHGYIDAEESGGMGHCGVYEVGS